ncbi:MAG TPA: CvpA family protein, partial [Kaistiaceae bacterium]|nr:CvpA family protein [Kaistiaceae bacterium]
IVSYVTMRISDFMLDSQIGALDRSLGFVFGAARGLLLCVIAVMFFNWLVAPDRQPNWVAGAKSKPMLDGLGNRIVSALPEDLESTILDRVKKKVLGKDGQGEDATPAEPDTDPAYNPAERQNLDQMIQDSAPAR